MVATRCVEAVGDRLLDVAVELRLRADLHEVDRHAGVGADEAVLLSAACALRSMKREGLARGVVGLVLARAAQRLLGVVRNLAQRPGIELLRNVPDQLLRDRHSGVFLSTFRRMNTA